jgi:hypothetical protein
MGSSALYNRLSVAVALFLFVLLLGCAAKRPVPMTTNAPPSPTPQPLRGEDVKAVLQAIAPKEFPKIPPANASGAWVAPGPPKPPEQAAVAEGSSGRDMLRILLEYEKSKKTS